ncbi:hypothetical protein HBI88_150400 [Parastagonospora nodorum]|nr:hypothetical protein HBI94_153040 [Parastagonospora nodorum]KAH5841746.1 hypothetical protein HBI93_011870 [Parastagonospora nodorum]KAH5919766.1 hypothetical protein HBI88_150400 [Parastagonospora nodorum]
MYNSMPTSLTKELGARHSLSNLSVHDLVEERRNYSLRFALLTRPFLPANANVIVRHSALNKYSKKHLKVREADALKQVGANVREGGNKNRSSLYYSDKSEAQLRKASKEEELAKTKKEKREKEAREREAGLDSLLDSDDYRLDSSPDINSEDDLEDEEATIAKDLAREQKERLKALLNAKMRDSLSARVGTAIEHCTLEE